MTLARTYPRFWDFLEADVRREYGLTMSRYDVLAQLDLAGGRLGLSELASRIWLSPSGLSKLLDRMDASVLIVREQDATDARSWFAVLTPVGRALVRRVRASHHARLASTFATVLTDRDLADLTRVMRRLSASIDGREDGEVARRHKSETLARGMD
jgi:DNA-binding MarR family transcriptional regulator